MTVRDILSTANQNTEFEIWASDSCVPILGTAGYFLRNHESPVLDIEVAEFEVCPVSCDAANLVIYVMGVEEKNGD